MSDEEVKEFIDHFGDKLPNPEHYPRQMAYYVKLWKYYKSKEVKNDGVQDPS